MTTKTPTFHDREFTVAHGRSPRGFGNWAFAPCDARGNRTGDVEFFSGTFSEARAEAKKHFAGEAHVTVCS